MTAVELRRKLRKFQVSLFGRTASA